jgi:hypothetical protein
MIPESEQSLLKSLCGALVHICCFFHVADVCMPVRITSYIFSELAETLEILLF